MRAATNQCLPGQTHCFALPHLSRRGVLTRGAHSRFSLLGSFSRTKVVSKKLRGTFCLRLCCRVSSPANVALLSVMWCLVIVIASITLTSQSHPVLSHQLNGRRHLNNVQSFKIGEDLRKKDDNPKIKPMILQRRPSPPTKHPIQQLPPAKQRYLNNKLVRSFGVNYEKSITYRRILYQCSDNKRKLGQVLNFNIAPYFWSQKELCQGQTDLLVAVHTRPSNFGKRQLIRETYGSIRDVHGKRVVVAFFVGNSGDRETQRLLHEEAREKRDVIVRDFKDHYRNMTIKHLVVMEWIMDHCSNAKYLVKADDDVFVNIFQVLTFVETFPPSGFYCSRQSKAKVQRRGKWRLTTQEYSRKTFPPYCMGYGYLMRTDHAKALYWCSVFSKFLWIDDVLVGGLLPEKLKINIEGFLHGHGVNYMVPSHASDKIADFMFLIGLRNTVVPSVFRRLWRAALQFSY